MAAPKRPRAVGRPTLYTKALADLVCSRLIDGESLREICRSEGMPDRSTVIRWLALHNEFRDQYAISRAEQADILFDELIDIADNASNDWMERKNADNENIGWIENGEAIRRSALRVDTRKWIVSKLLPKKYGDLQRLEHSGPDGGPIQTKTEVDLGKALEKLSDEELEALRGIAAKVASGE